MATHHTPGIRIIAGGVVGEVFGFEWIYQGPRTGRFSVEEDRAKVMIGGELSTRVSWLAVDPRERAALST